MTWTTRTTIAAVVLLAVAAGLALFATLGTTRGDNPGERLTLSLYMRGTDQSINLSQPPEPGQQNIVGSDIYLLGGTEEQPAPDGDPIGRRIGVCTVVTSSEAVCVGVLDLDGRGTISAQLEVLIPGGNQGIAITGGTAEFAGAAGTIAERPVTGQPNDRILDIEIIGLRR